MSAIEGLRNIMWCAETSDAIECLQLAVPFLRAHAASCEACGGSGERIVGNAPDDYWSEPCKECESIWNLIERIGSPAASASILAPIAPDDNDDNPF